MKKVNFNTLLASSVHDMKNSLSILSSGVENLLHDKNIAPAFGKDLSVIHYQTERLNNELLQLLMLYKLDTGHYLMSRQSVSVLDVMKEVSLNFELLAKSQGVILECQVGNELWWSMDVTLVQSGLHNLLTNAIRYASKTVTLSSQVVDGVLCFSIQDDGQGFLPEMLGTKQSGVFGLNTGNKSTNLGHYFADLAARLHDRECRLGKLLLSNNQCGGLARALYCSLVRAQIYQLRRDSLAVLAGLAFFCFWAWRTWWNFCFA